MSPAVTRHEHAAVAALARIPRTGVPAVALRAAAVTAVAVVAARVYGLGDPGVLCPLRRFTGVPCPVCGSTTAFVELGSGSLAGALAANPVTVLAAVTLLLAPLGVGRAWSRWRTSARAVALGLAVLTAWMWQLERFGLLGV